MQSGDGIPVLRLIQPEREGESSRQIFNEAKLGAFGVDATACFMAKIMD